jgi:hypothetical protein
VSGNYKRMIHLCLSRHCLLGCSSDAYPSNRSSETTSTCISTRLNLMIFKKLKKEKPSNNRVRPHCLALLPLCRVFLRLPIHLQETLTTAKGTRTRVSCRHRQRSPHSSHLGPMEMTTRYHIAIIIRLEMIHEMYVQFIFI